MAIEHDAYGHPLYAQPKNSHRMVADAMMTQMGYPTPPAAPPQPAIGMGFGPRNTLAGAAAGAGLGAAFAGPFGALAGGAIGAGIQQARMGTPSSTAQSAMRGGWDGFGGLTTDQLVEAHRPASSGGGSYASLLPSPDPHQAFLAKGQKSIDAARQELAQSQPQTLGAGIEALGQGINLALRQRAQGQAAADPWSGMRQATQPAGGGFDIGGAFKRLFG